MYRKFALDYSHTFRRAHNNNAELLKQRFSLPQYVTSVIRNKYITRTQNMSGDMIYIIELVRIMPA